MRSGDVEKNLGPADESNKTVNISTFNINGGLANPIKQKQLLNKLRKPRNLIVALQETHLTAKDEFALKARWGH